MSPESPAPREPGIQMTGALNIGHGMTYSDKSNDLQLLHLPNPRQKPKMKII